MKKIISPLFCAALFFVACGDENTTNITETTGISMVEKGAKAPDCTADNAGDLIYMADSAAAFFCADGKWTAMTATAVENGKDGKNGSDGEDGKDGSDGKDGKNGKSGKDGTSCVVKPIEGGYKVLCGGDSVGVLLNGAKGDSGAQGVKGEDGKSAYELSGTDKNLKDWLASLKGENGTSCNIESDNNGEVVIKCGDKETTFYKAMCGTKPYDPAEQFCEKNEVYDKCGSSKAVYNPDEKFCAKFADKTEQIYKMVTIAPAGTDYSETWMAENLNYATPVNGSDSSSFCYGDGDEGVTDRGAANCTKYGRLYTWAAAVGKPEEDCGYEKDCDLGEGDIQGVCPEGWHLPSKAEWEALIVAVDGSIESYTPDNVAGKKLKSATEWTKDGSVPNDDTYSFAALPAGHYDGDIFGGEEDNTSFWSSTQDSGRDAYNVDLNYHNDYARLYYLSKDYRFSVRCIKNE
ncbi:MAG: hypothetical protein J6U20_01145 [Fibrobacter sp.]|nr:hypothetical protein [Fibrobacter sp.]